MPPGPPQRDLGRLLVVASALLAVAAAAFALFGPTGVEETASEPAVLQGQEEAVSSTEVERRWTTTWGQIREGEEDAFVLWALAFPVVVALAALAVDATRWRRVSRGIAAALLGAFAFVTGFSVGLLFLPSAGAMIAAAVVGGRVRGSGTPSHAYGEPPG